MEWEPTIGLEIHAELKTKSKMFCSCKNDPEEKIPNTNICPICLAHPGTLPVANKKAIYYVVRVGLALQSHIPEYSKFDRKNYFYPDLPKGYQISQYDQPICQGGKLALYLGDDKQEIKKEIQITRVHLEEDVGKIIHVVSNGKPTATLIDYNRAGIPLMELVTEPVIRNGKEARLFAKGLQLLLRTLGVSNANMEKGEMRCEVNISLHPKGSNKLGTKVEIKNLNSFRAVEQAINYEIQRQSEALNKEEKIIQETRGWDSTRGITYSQRKKENAKDYRYLPEPDLPPLHLYSQKEQGGLFNLEEIRKELPELPWTLKNQIIDRYKLTPVQANFFLFNPKFLEFFKQIINKKGEEISSQFVSLAYNYLASDVKGFLEKNNTASEDIPLKTQDFISLIQLLEKEEISSRAGKDVLLEMIKTGKNPQKIIDQKGLKKISNTNDLLPIIKEIIAQNDKAVADYKKGKENALKFLVGQGMARTRGAADPLILEKLFKENL